MVAPEPAAPAAGATGPSDARAVTFVPRVNEGGADACETDLAARLGPEETAEESPSPRSALATPSACGAASDSPATNAAAPTRAPRVIPDNSTLPDARPSTPRKLWHRSQPSGRAAFASGGPGRPATLTPAARQG